jgi:hypothetical protein
MHQLMDESSPSKDRRTRFISANGIVLPSMASARRLRFNLTRTSAPLRFPRRLS